jgi:hypothetical protein
LWKERGRNEENEKELRKKAGKVVEGGVVAEEGVEARTN